MAKILRKTQLIFGSAAGLNQIAEFGSLAAASPVFTTDPAVIQSLSNFLTGWFGAVIGGNSPAIEDMNALCYLYAYQLAYLMQAGVPEWDSATIYFTGSLASSNGITYVSLTDNNTGNALTDSTKWAQPPQNGTVTPNTLPATTVVATGNTLTWPNAIVPTGKNVTVQTGANFIGVTSLTLQGTATLTLQGTATARIL